MALVACRDCGQQISTDCAACPRCGKPTKARGMGGCSIIFLVFIGLGVLGSLVSTTSRHGTADHENSVVAPEPPDPKVTAMADAKVAFHCYTGSILLCDFTVSNNNSDFIIKDIEITCKAFGKSETEIDSNKRTIYDKVESHSKKRFPKFNMGFVHSQAVSSSCRITNLTAYY